MAASYYVPVMNNDKMLNFQAVVPLVDAIYHWNRVVWLLHKPIVVLSYDVFQRITERRNIAIINSIKQYFSIKWIHSSRLISATLISGERVREPMFHKLVMQYDDSFVFQRK